MSTWLVRICHVTSLDQSPLTDVQNSLDICIFWSATNSDRKTLQKNVALLIFSTLHPNMQIANEYANIRCKYADIQCEYAVELAVQPSSSCKQFAHHTWTSLTKWRPPMLTSFIVDRGRRTQLDELLIAFTLVLGGSSVSSRLGRFLLPTIDIYIDIY